MQWGLAIESISTTDFIYFPTSFSHNYSITAVVFGQHGTQSYYTWVVQENLSAFTCGINNGYGGGGTVQWIALGH